jgi:ABC-type transport system substrate-binding protein
MSWKYVGDGPDVTGPEDIYEGLNWTHVVNQMGFGVNSWWTFLNAYPYDHPTGNGHMTMRYGWKVKGYPKHLNPLYAEWYWDHEVLNKIYDSLGFRDPYDLGIWRSWLIRGFEPGTWEHPTEGTCTKLTLYLREDIKWSDGTPLTMDDVVFTLVESTPMLLAKGYAPPWYYSNVEHIVSYSVLDPYTIELLLDVKSWWAAGWILGGEYIIPKHIWKPIIETGDPSGFKPDAALVGTGPFKFVSHTPDVSVVLQRNPATFAAEPVDVSVSTGSIVHRIAPSTTVTFSISLHNLWQGGNLNVHKKVSFVYPNDTEVVITEHDVTLAPCTPDTEPFTIHVSDAGFNKIKVYVHILGPDPWTSTEFTFVFPIWATISEDLNLDFKVNILDIIAIGAAFGSRPGDSNWNARADLVRDYKINILDMIKAATKFGWPGS